ncbi:MAG: DNA double-strand break repair nuclease NurA [Candidatus Korarchaeota archaeon]
MALESMIVDMFKLIDERVRASVEELHAVYRKLQKFIINNSDMLSLCKIPHISWYGRMGGVDGSEHKIERRGIVLIGVSASGIVVDNGNIDRYKEFDINWLNGFAQEDVAALTSISRQYMERHMQINMSSKCDLLLVDGPPYPHGMSLDSFVSAKSITSKYAYVWDKIYGENGLMEAFIDLGTPHAYIIKNTESNEYIRRMGITPDQGLSRIRDIDLMNMILPPANDEYIIISEPRPVSVERIRVAQKKVSERYASYINEMYFFYMRVSSALPIRVEVHKSMLPNLSSIVNAIADATNTANNVPWILEIAHEHSQLDTRLLSHVADRIMNELFNRVKDDTILNLFAPNHGSESFWFAKM